MFSTWQGPATPATAGLVSPLLLSTFGSPLPQPSAARGSIVPFSLTAGTAIFPPAAQGAAAAAAEGAAGAAPAVPDGVVSLEDEYASILGGLLSDEADAKDALGGLEMLCQQRAQQLWREAQQALHKPVRYMHLQALAQELEAQTATWHLVWCLFCNEQPPCGTGGQEVVGGGGKRTARQMLADAVSQDPTLTRCAAVVSWLESLAEDALLGEGSAAGGGAPAPRFAQHEGVWLETKQRLGAGGLVSELDPDAPGRQAAGLHPDNQAAEERLLARCWQLVRSGRHADARALCRACGQPWRAASLGGPAGEWGPLPVGVAAARLEEESSPEVQVEELAAEVELGGPAAPRALWKWSCLQVALQASRSNHTAGGQYEAALYGLQASHLPSLLPLCPSWRDQCWALCRTWLDQAAEEALAAEQQHHHQGAAALPARAAAGGVAPLLAQLPGDEVVVEVACKWATSSSSSSSSQLQQRGGAASPAAAAEAKAAALAALAAASTGVFVPPGADGSAGGGGGAEVARSFSAVFEALSESGAAAVAAAAKEPLHLVQQLLIQDAMSGLAQHLHAWLVGGGEAPGQGGGGAEGAERDDALLGLPPRPARAAAFGCHLLLALEALGVLYASPSAVAALAAGGRGGAAPTLSATRISGLIEQVVSLYVAGLMERDRHELVPQYLCHVSQSLREMLARECLTALSAQLLQQQEGAAAAGAAAADARARAVFDSMGRWFAHCRERQARQRQEERLLALGGGGGGDADMDEGLPQLPRSYLQTTIRPEELRHLLYDFVTSVRTSSLAEGSDGAAMQGLAGADGAPPGSPGRGGAPPLGGLGSSALGRVTVARWLLFFFKQQQEEGEEEAEAGGDDDDAGVEGSSWYSCWLDALEVLGCLCADLSLGDGRALAAAQHLTHQVLPTELPGLVAERADSLEQRAHRLRARVAATRAAVTAGDAAQERQLQQELERREGVAATLQAAAHLLRSYSAELRAWRQLFAALRDGAVWLRAAGEARVRRGPGGEAEVQALREGGALILITAQSNLLSGQWMAGLPLPTDASDAPPDQDSAPATVILVLTQSSAAAGAAFGLPGAAAAPPQGLAMLAIEGSAWAAAEAPTREPYPSLRGAELASLEQRLRASLGSACAALNADGGGAGAGPQVAYHVASGAGAEGHVTVELTGRAGNAEDARALLQLASGVVQGSLPHLPPALRVVNLLAPRPFTLAVATRCSLAKVALLSARVRHGVAALGGDGAAGEDLVSLLATLPVHRDVAAGWEAREGDGGAGAASWAGGAPRLSDVLSAAQLAEVVQLEAETVVELLAHDQAARLRQ